MVTVAARSPATAGVRSISTSPCWILESTGTHWRSSSNNPYLSLLWQFSSKTPESGLTCGKLIVQHLNFLRFTQTENAGLLDTLRATQMQALAKSRTVSHSEELAVR